MKFAVINDTHVTSNSDANYELLLKFLKHPITNSCQEIFLLGDIFDLMCGNHKIYLEIYQTYFSLIASLLDQGKKIHYFEGNHDLHLNLLYKNISKQSNNLFIHKKPLMKTFNSKIYYFSHGDELNLSHKKYLLYKKIISNCCITPIANYIVPYFLLDKVGKIASCKSKKRNQKYKTNLQKIRQQYRLDAIKLVGKQKIDYMICGHSHVKDDFQNDNFRYINNGDPLNEKTFILIEDEKFSFVDI